MLYRFKALGKRRDPDQLDTPLTLASPNGWIVTLVIGFCMLALIGWGILGRIPQQVTASGRLQYPGGLVTVQSDSNGIVSGLADLGTVITQGGVIASLHQESGASDTQIVGVTGGRIVQHLVELGTAVTTGTPIAVVEPGADSRGSSRAGRGDSAWSRCEADGVGGGSYEIRTAPRASAVSCSLPHER